uniref:Ribosomal protein S1 n=1 Tax=Anotrichium furcellatum TaxID=41999 RepID=A0A4D6WLW4_9FLOR|nr:ribosomal protein S1 [Anotrichium furcellatum]
MLYKYQLIYKKKFFSEILNRYQYNINSGEIVGGIIKYKEINGLLVDTGDKISSYLPFEEITIEYHKKNYSFNDLLYMKRDFFLITHKNYIKKSILSIKRLEYMRAWKRIKQIYLEDIIFKLPIQYINKGGIITYLEGLQSFIPNSCTDGLYNQKLKYTKNIYCKLLFINENKNEIILSQKSALLHLSKHKFRLNELIYGKIIVIQNYGIFVDIYGILGLLHISEISCKYINDIHNIFLLKDLIKVKIIHININQGRISLSTKKLK